MGTRQLEFRLLAPLEVRERDRSLPLGGMQQRALLAILLLHANEVVSSNRLIDELWGEAPRELCTGFCTDLSAHHRIETYGSGPERPHL